ncbi:hypothetical protein DUI87_31522 [Hirundo rustica rustica]|uniref:Uncharacterized protein n=1 Tax=Hirundo rustica rustica TaxID=333673 RepID=A0A3M0IZ26_HIRRU|nr:hypothetical protein DUI87_31522 [Hirundo rustica rustica]
MATEILWRTGARGGIQGKLRISVELLVWNYSVASPERLRHLNRISQACQGALHCLPKESGAKGRPGFAKRNLGQCGETSGWGWEFWRIKDKPTETEGTLQLRQELCLQNFPAMKSKS